MWKPIYHPGPWQQYLKRKDNVGLPLMEVRKKYLTEQLQFQNFQSSQLAMLNGAAGGVRNSNSDSRLDTYPDQVIFEGGGAVYGTFSKSTIAVVKHVGASFNAGGDTSTFGTNSTFTYNGSDPVYEENASSTTGIAFYIPDNPAAQNAAYIAWSIILNTWLLAGGDVYAASGGTWNYNSDGTGISLVATQDNAYSGPVTPNSPLGLYNNGPGTLVEV